MKSLFLIAFSTIGLTIFGQPKNIKIYENNAMPIGVCEPSIIINPNNPANVIAGGILDFVFVSNDSGATWNMNTLKSESGVYGDPCLVADNKNHVYYLHLSDPEGKGWASEKLLDRIVVQRSDDGGENWSMDGYTGMNHPKDQDKQWACTDFNDQNVIVTWTEFDKYNSKDTVDKSNILFSRSEDLGKTFSEPIRVNQFSGDCLDDDLTTEGAVPAVGPNGEYYVAWSYDDKIYFDRSFDKGKTWLDKDAVVSEQPGGWTMDIPGIQRCNGMPITVSDISEGPFKGAVYVCWADKRNGDDNSDIFVSSSMDRGTTWSLPVKINDDSTNTQQFFPWMSIDPITGHLSVVFYDRRNHSDNNTEVYYAYSKDAGQTWVNEKISESPFTPIKYIFFGDYNNISAYDGNVRPIWTRYEKGKLSIWTALISIQ
jgi:hypothetical protein